MCVKKPNFYNPASSLAIGTNRRTFVEWGGVTIHNETEAKAYLDMQYEKEKKASRAQTRRAPPDSADQRIQQKYEEMVKYSLREDELETLPERLRVCLMRVTPFSLSPFFSSINL